jgi:catechol 2,3-dioxygenase-like lactoylglutathione lyase family enzyme
MGSGVLCLVKDWPLERTLAHLAAEGVEVVEGPATKEGALGPITSVYVRDEDGNLIEIARYEGQE